MAGSALSLVQTPSPYQAFGLKPIWPLPPARTLARDSPKRVLARVLAAGARRPCQAHLRSVALLRDAGLGSLMNLFVDEMLTALLLRAPVARCAPDGVHDVWAASFEQEVDIPRCTRCDAAPFGQGDWTKEPWYIAAQVHEAWARSHVADLKRFLYRTLFVFRKEVTMAADQISSRLVLHGQPYIGVHIRRGDKFLEAAPVAIRAYATEVQRLVSNGRVFLASDSPQAQGKLQAMLGPRFVVVQQPRLPQEAYALRGVRRAERRDWDATNVSRQQLETHFFIDVLLLLRATVFVGTASSNLGRFVHFLRSPELTTVSLDFGGDFLRWKSRSDPSAWHRGMVANGTRSLLQPPGRNRSAGRTVRSAMRM